MLDEHDEKILVLMRQNSRIKVSEISLLVGLGMTTVTKRISILREKRFVQRVGSKKTGQWAVRGRQE